MSFNLGSLDCSLALQMVVGAFGAHCTVPGLHLCVLRSQQSGNSPVGTQNLMASASLSNKNSLKCHMLFGMINIPSVISC